MGADKSSSAKGGGGFFNLLDWNRKPRKRLFVPERVKEAAKSDDNSKPMRHQMNDGKDFGGLQKLMEIGDYSRSPSFTDDDSHGTRAPGVVARLMGLDSIPTTNTSEPFYTPVFEPRSFYGTQYQSTGPGFDVNNPLTIGLLRTEAYSRKHPDVKRQKMPSSPIEKFQTEVLPSRSAKNLPITYQKLLSPMKKSRFISFDDATHIMEAAVKIIEPRVHAHSNDTRISLLGSSRSLKSRDAKESAQSLQRMSTPLVLSKKHAGSNSVKHFKSQSLDKKCHSECNKGCRSISNRLDSNFIGTKSKGKSVSLAVQMEFNTHQSGRMNTLDKDSLMLKESDACKLEQPHRDQKNVRKNKIQQRVPISNSSGNNNNKQNCYIGKDKISTKSLAKNKQAKKSVSVGVSERTVSVNKLHGKTKNEHGKEGLETILVDKKRLLKSNKSSRTGTKADNNIYSEKNMHTTNIVVDRFEKHLPPDTFINEHKQWINDDRKKCMDVVSFSFSSPISKSSVSQSSTKMKQKHDARGRSNASNYNQANADDVKNKPVSSLQLDLINGEDLNNLLERKLSQLTLELESSPSSKVEDKQETISACTLQELLSSSLVPTFAATKEHEKDIRWNLDNIPNSDCCTSDGQITSEDSEKFQVLENDVECNSRKISCMQLDVEQPSPFSVLDTSLSYETFCCAVPSISGSGSFSACQNQDTIGMDFVRELSFIESDRGASDSSSSTLTQILDEEVTENVELVYVSDIMSAAESFGGGSLDPFIFEQLESKKSKLGGNSEYDRLNRKVLFDCICECLDMKHDSYLNIGYQTWSKGVKLVGKMASSEAIYQEISRWRLMKNIEVDEIINREMSKHFGKWGDFEVYAFEIGIMIQGKILGNLIDEIVHDLFLP